MKVLWFSNSPASGAEYLKSGGLGGGWLSSLDKFLADKVDLHITFYYPKFNQSFEYFGNHYYPLCDKNWRFNWLKNILFDKPLNDNDLSMFLYLIDQIKPDVIHILGTENTFGVLTKHTSIPVVVSIQGNITVCKNKYFTGIERFYTYNRDYSSLFAWLTSRSFFENFKRFEVLSKLERRNLHYVNHIIGRTDWDRRIMSVMSPNSKYYHNDEVLRPLFYENHWKNPENNKYIIHTTNGNSIFKGFETICETLFELNQLGFDIEWRVAGVRKSDQIVKIVKRILKDRFPSKGLVLLGGLNEQELVEKLLEADLYVMPSHIENSPNNLCEAMILGMPCIATYAGGTGSLMTDGEDGVLIQDGDPWVMAGAILELSRDPDLAKEYGRKARIRAIKRHDKSTIVDGLINIYEQIIDASLSGK